ncbi:glycosyltransferase family 1 protein [Nocardia yamanashiensis]|uniref:glycosyltransferase family 1 protein n=1 Tax=Nocardia yamanashiensis TaxID=209247 RepID=UPI001E364EAE|nr:glycosyltransferase family 1 protein [Nocardia yamanashiensis]UGT43857.1 glycosyltransferase family 1 protein [Nocardia yamanashiensis]
MALLASPGLIRVASVPASHVYVRHLSPVHGRDTVIRLADPAPADGRKVPGGWWPPVMLEPGWIREHHAEFDLFHIHFGFDAVPPRTLGEIIELLRAYRKPLVYTVHDLRNPHQPDPASHDRLLDTLIPAADALITLTPGAAATIARRWERAAQVLAHPHVVTPELMRAARPRERRFVVGVHVKSLRANMDPLPVLETLCETVPALPGGELRIDVHDELFEPGNHWYDPETGDALRALGERPGVRVSVHPYFTDAELWQYLSSLTVSVLPYRFGTHSGWLEACHDLGTAVVAPDCGFYHQQRRCAVYGFDERRFDPGSLRRAIIETYRAPAPRANWPERRAERESIAVAHRRLYESLLR